MTDKKYSLIDLMLGRHHKVEEEKAKPETKVEVFNPLGLALGDVVLIDQPVTANNRFALAYLDVVSRRINGKIFRSADYVLLDPNDTKDAGEGKTVLLRIIPQDSPIPGSPPTLEALLLFPDITSEYDEGVEKSLNDGILPAEDEAYAGFIRPSGVTTSYNAKVEEHSKNGVERLEITYWDFIRGEGEGMEIFFAEMSMSDGHFECYRGTLIDPELVTCLRINSGE